MIGIDAAVFSIWIHRRRVLIWALTGTISEIYRAHRPLPSLPGDPPALRRGLNARRIQQWQCSKSRYHKTFLSSFGSETTLGCTRQLTGRLSNARIAMPPPDERLVEIRHIAKSPQPGERASCSAWAICLGSAGRLHVARQSLFGERAAQCQESSNRATRKASITLTGLGNATILCADPGSGGTPRAIRSNDATAVRHAFRWRCADRGNNCGAGAICSKVGPTTSRQDA